MSCINPIITNIDKLCGLRNSGGLKTTVYITEMENVTGYTASDGTITAIGMGASASFYAINIAKNSSTLAESEVTNPNTGTIVVTQTLTLIIPRIRNAVRQTLLTYNNKELVIIAQDQNEQWRLLGETNGVFLTQNDNATGAALADANGYTLTFIAEEGSPAQFVTEGAVNAVI